MGIIILLFKVLTLRKLSVSLGGSIILLLNVDVLTGVVVIGTVPPNAFINKLPTFFMFCSLSVDIDNIVELFDVPNVVVSVFF